MGEKDLYFQPEVLFGFIFRLKKVFFFFFYIFEFVKVEMFEREVWDCEKVKKVSVKHEYI